MEMSSKLFCPFKDFFILMEYSEVVVKKKITAGYACRNADLNLILVAPMINRFIL